MFCLIKISIILKILFSRGCIWELNMLLENFWSDWIQLDLINTLRKIFAWMSPLFFDVSRRDLAIEEEGDCLENFHVGKILIGIIRILGRQDIVFRRGGNLKVNGNFNQTVVFMAWHCFSLRRYLDNRNGKGHSVIFMSNDS